MITPDTPDLDEATELPEMTRVAGQLALEPLAGLMVRRAALLEELGLIAASLKARGLGRTDQVVGELGERLSLAVYGGMLEAVSAKGIDLVRRRRPAHPGQSARGPDWGESAISLLDPRLRRRRLHSV